MWMGGVTDHMTLEQTGATVVSFGVGGTERLIRTIREIGINAISCTPSYPVVLERVLQRIRESWGIEPIGINRPQSGITPGNRGNYYRLS